MRVQQPLRASLSSGCASGSPLAGAEGRVPILSTDVELVIVDHMPEDAQGVLVESGGLTLLLVPRRLIAMVERLTAVVNALLAHLAHGTINLRFATA